jgi:hypothetical protein
MKHFGFTAAELIGYIRVCRPGSIIGPQQQYMGEIEPKMWAEGDLFRRHRGECVRAVLLSSFVLCLYCSWGGVCMVHRPPPPRVCLPVKLCCMSPCCAVCSSLR